MLLLCTCTQAPAKALPSCRWLNGDCRFGDRCNFAHGETELRQIPGRGRGRGRGAHVRSGGGAGRGLPLQHVRSDHGQTQQHMFSDSQVRNLLRPPTPNAVALHAPLRHTHVASHCLRRVRRN